MTINNVSQNQYLNNIDKSKQGQESAMEKIAATRALSGVDGANMIIADNLMSQSNVLEQGIANANDAIGMLGIADSTLSNLTKSADRLNELSVRMNNPALSSREQNMLQSEAKALTESMTQSVNNASFNGRNVFGGELNFNTGDGMESINLSQNSITGAIDNLNVNNGDSIRAFMDNVNSMRSEIGSAQSGILSGITSSLTQSVALRQSESNMQNNDVAKNLNEQNQNNLTLNAAILTQTHNVANMKQQIDRLLA